MQYSVNHYAIQFVLKCCLKQVGVISNPFDANKDVTFDNSRFFAVVESDYVGERVVVKIILVDLQELLV